MMYGFISMHDGQKTVWLQRVHGARSVYRCFVEQLLSGPTASALFELSEEVVCSIIL